MKFRRLPISVVGLMIAVGGCGHPSPDLVDHVGKLISLGNASHCLDVEMKPELVVGVETICSPDAGLVDERTGWIFVAEPMPNGQLLVALIGSNSGPVDVVLMNGRRYTTRTDTRGFLAIKIRGKSPIAYFSVKTGYYALKRCLPEPGFPSCNS